MEIDLFQASTLDPKVLLQCLVGVVLLIGIVFYLNVRYQWFKKIRRLREEMEYLELNPTEETILTDMIKRYRLNEPVDMLLSLKLFDELATKEMYRILQSVGTSSAKQKSIELVYEIRQRTFFSEWNQQNQNTAFL